MKPFNFLIGLLFLASCSGTHQLAETKEFDQHISSEKEIVKLAPNETLQSALLKNNTFKQYANAKIALDELNLRKAKEIEERFKNMSAEERKASAEMMKKVRAEKDSMKVKNGGKISVSEIKSANSKMEVFGFKDYTSQREVLVESMGGAYLKLLRIFPQLRNDPYAIDEAFAEFSKKK